MSILDILTRWLDSALDWRRHVKWRFILAKARRRAIKLGCSPAEFNDSLDRCLVEWLAGFDQSHPGFSEEFFSRLEATEASRYSEQLERYKYLCP